MSKLTVANLFHSVRKLSASHGISPRSAHLIGENLWRLTADADSGPPRVDLSDLLAAVRYVFDANQDKPLSPERDFAAWRLQQAERQLRFDPDHRGAATAGGRFERLALEPAKQALLKGLGAAAAREALGHQHWIVVVVDARAPSAELSAELLDALHRQQRILVLWCDERQSAENAAIEPRESAATAFDQLAIDPKLICLGPISGLEMDGVIAVLEALKALESPAVLHLRLRAPAPLPAMPDVNAHRPAALEVAAQRFVRFAQTDRRLACVNLLPAGLDQAAGCLSLAGMVRRKLDADAIAWCAGLADGGCRPFLWLDRAGVKRLWSPLVELISDAQRTATIIAVPGDDPESAAVGLDQLRLLPHTAIFVPSDAAEFEEMLGCAADHDGPAAIWLPTQLAEPTGDDSSRAPVSFGQAVQVGYGSDIGLLAIGAEASLAREVANRLAAEGVGASVLNLRFAAPVDEAAVLQVAQQVRAIAVLEAGEPSGGLAAQLLQIVSSREVGQPVAIFKPRVQHDSAEHYVDQIVAQCLRLTVASAIDGSISPSAFAELSRPSRSERSTLPSFSPQEEHAQIRAKRFSPTVLRWIEDYSATGDRSLYLWQWCLHGVELTTLPFVPDELRSHACDTKFLSGMLNVLLDDVADQKRNGDLLDELFKTVAGNSGSFARFSAAERQYAELTCRLWSMYWQRVREYPAYETYRDLLHYDLTQLVNTVRYSHLVNRDLSLLNIIEHDHYSPQGMGLMSFSTVDLMCAPNFPRRELGPLREAMWHAQWMARIGNLVTTWQREIVDGDYTSGVFARAVGRCDLTFEQLEQGDAGEIESAVRRGKHETHFLHRWQYHRNCLRALTGRIQSFDLNVVVHGLERLLHTELGSRGFK